MRTHRLTFVFVVTTNDLLGSNFTSHINEMNINKNKQQKYAHRQSFFFFLPSFVLFMSEGQAPLQY